MSRRMWTIIVAVAVAAGLVVAGAIGAGGADDGLIRTTTVVETVPLTTVRAADAGSGLPGAVVVHGFAGSARLMFPLADTLARNGYLVVLPDLSGHAANQRRLDLTAVESDLGSDLDIAVRFLRSQRQVNPTRTVLVGHSMGAAAVTAYATDRSDVAATVAISLRDASELPADWTRPRNLLVLYGGQEFAGFKRAGQEALLAPDPTGTYELGRTYGDASLGTARRSEAVSGTEHISILYSDAAHRLMLSWLANAVHPSAAPQPPAPRDALNAASLLLLGMLIGFYPLVTLLMPRASAGSVAGVSGANARDSGLGIVAGLGVGGLTGVVASDTVLGLAVGGYTALVFAAMGSGALLTYGLITRRRPHGPEVRSIAAGVLLMAYAAATVAIPSHVGFNHSLLQAPARWWLLFVVGAGCFPLFLAAELLGGRRAFGQAVVVGAGVVLLTGLTVIGPGPGFTLLVLPLLAALLVFQAGFAAILRRVGAAPWIGAAAGAALLAWPITASLPLV